MSIILKFRFAALAAFSIPALAQVEPMNLDPMPCKGIVIHDQESKIQSALPRREFRVRSSGLCSEYSFAGWESSMRLYLGEGAQEFKSDIERAVDVWNNSLLGFSNQEVILLARAQPRSYTLPAEFWTDTRLRNRVVDDNLDDGESVIYFHGDEDTPGDSFAFAAFRRTRSNRMAEADIYINTYIHHLLNNRSHSARAVEIQFVEDLDETIGIYVMLDYYYVTILHELGHAVG